MVMLQADFPNSCDVLIYFQLFVLFLLFFHVEILVPPFSNFLLKLLNIAKINMNLRKQKQN